MSIWFAITKRPKRFQARDELRARPFTALEEAGVSSRLVTSIPHLTEAGCQFQKFTSRKPS